MARPQPGSPSRIGPRQRQSLWLSGVILISFLGIGVLAAILALQEMATLAKLTWGQGLAALEARIVAAEDQFEHEAQTLTAAIVDARDRRQWSRALRLWIRLGSRSGGAWMQRSTRLRSALERLQRSDQSYAAAALLDVRGELIGAAGPEQLPDVHGDLAGPLVRRALLGSTAVVTDVTPLGEVFMWAATPIERRGRRVEGALLVGRRLSLTSAALGNILWFRDDQIVRGTLPSGAAPVLPPQPPGSAFRWVTELGAPPHVVVRWLHRLGAGEITWGGVWARAVMLPGATHVGGLAVYDASKDMLPYRQAQARLAGGALLLALFLGLLGASAMGLTTWSWHRSVRRWRAGQLPPPVSRRRWFQRSASIEPNPAE